MHQRVLIYVVASVVFLFSAGPLILTALGGVIPDAALLSVPPKWFSKRPTLDYYRYIFFGVVPGSYEVRGSDRGMISQEARQIPRAMLNSAIVATAVMAVNIVFASMAGYAFARINFKGKQLTFMGIVMCRLIPAAALVVPFYLIVQAAGLLNRQISIIAVHSLLTLPFSVLILSLFFQKIPIEIEESAKVDGANPLTIFRRITIPLSASSIVATGLFAFMLSYSEFLYALVLGGTSRTRTISVVMASLSTNTDVAWGMLMAGVFLTLIPTLLLVVCIWKLVVENIILGASKY
jgi:ABC-type glycerol-3-phosphate transport system permease component